MDENGKGTMGCGLRMGLSWGWLVGLRGKERRRRVPRAVYVPYFDDIRQGALQSQSEKGVPCMCTASRVDGKAAWIRQ